MDFFSYILFLIIWIIIWWIVTYMWANYKYNNKKEIDFCFEEREELRKENKELKENEKKLNEEIKKLKKELEIAHREISEKNKYLSEDKVIVERLFEVKQLADQISKTLIDYDKNTIQHLLDEYTWRNGKIKIHDNELEEEKKHSKILWW